MIKKPGLPLLALSGLFAVAMAAPASALSDRTWVSGVGSDLNPCSRTAPCKTFSFAHANTNPAGVINCLDSGDFGPLIITKSITIKCTGVEGGIIAPSVTVGIKINAGPTDTIVLDGLDIDGLGTGDYGIFVVSAAKVFVNRTSIRRFGNHAIALQSTTVGAHLFVDDCYIANNGGGVIVSNTSNIASVTNTKILASQNQSVFVSVPTGVIGVQNSVLNDSPVGIRNPNNATVVTVGPSNLVTGAGSFTATAPFN
jgi:hypothetical protein